MAVADFYAEAMALLAEAGLPSASTARRTRSIPPSPSPRTARRAPTIRDSARRLLGALLEADRVLRLFRSSFLGKVSPVHFFWGSFDLAVTRFSGRPAPRHPGGIPHLPDDVTREAYSHEVSSAGFWPGGAGVAGGPFFYSYAYPPPDGIRRGEGRAGSGALRRGAWRVHPRLRGGARPPPIPTRPLLAFLHSTYEAAADLGRWDRAALECEPGRPRVPRPV